MLPAVEPIGCVAPLGRAGCGAESQPCRGCLAPGLCRASPGTGLCFGLPCCQLAGPVLSPHPWCLWWRWSVVTRCWPEPKVHAKTCAGKASAACRALVCPAASRTRGNNETLMPHLLSSPSLTVCFPPPFPLSLPKASESPSRASAGPVVLAVTVAVPVCVLSLVAVLAACACQGRRCAYGRKKQPNVEEPLSECNLVSSGKTLKDLIYDMTTSGSGSGTGVSLGALRLVSTSTVGSGAAVLALSLAPCGASEQTLVILSQVLTCRAVTDVL